MSDLALPLLVCGSLIVIAGVAGMAYLFVTSPRSKDQTVADAPRPAQTGFTSWIVPLIIAFALSFWSSVFALFFLSIVWVLRLNPKTDSKEIPYPSEKDRQRAKGTYTWLLLSPILNVAVLLTAVVNTYSSQTSTNEWVLVALLPLIFHLPVLIRLDSNNPFVFRHTQQAILLLALRAATTGIALIIGRYPEDGIWFFLLSNGFLWLFGSFWGRGQAHRGTGWWIGRRGGIVLAREAVTVTESSIPGDEPGEKLKSLNTRGITARQQALSAFRIGTLEERKKALYILTELGEVEKF